MAIHLVRHGETRLEVQTPVARDSRPASERCGLQASSSLDHRVHRYQPLLRARHTAVVIRGAERWPPRSGEVWESAYRPSAAIFYRARVWEFAQANTSVYVLGSKEREINRVECLGHG